MQKSSAEIGKELTSEGVETIGAGVKEGVKSTSETIGGAFGYAQAGASLYDTIAGAGKRTQKENFNSSIDTGLTIASLITPYAVPVSLGYKLWNTFNR